MRVPFLQEFGWLTPNQEEVFTRQRAFHSAW